MQGCWQDRGVSRLQVPRDPEPVSPAGHSPVWQRLTQRCCHQLGLQLLEEQGHVLPGQVLLQDGAVHGVQSLAAGKTHGEDAEVALQRRGTTWRGHFAPRGLMQAAGTAGSPALIAPCGLWCQAQPCCPQALHTCSRESMVKEPAVGFMQATYWQLRMSFRVSLFLSYLCREQHRDTSPSDGDSFPPWCRAPPAPTSARGPGAAE